MNLILIIIIILIKLILYFLIILKLKKNFKIKNINKIKLINKGKYISRIANCLSCHTQYGNKPFSGGLPFKTNFGILYSPNITNNIKYGISGASLSDFIKILKFGISKKNKFLYPIMPFVNFNNIKNKDIINIYLFFKNIKSLNICNKINKLNIIFKYRKIILAWRIMFFKKLRYINYKKINNSYIRGEYIIKNLAHCNMCHSNIKKLFGVNFRKEIFLKNKLKNFNLNKINNIKKYKLIELIKILKFGIIEKKYIKNKMAEVINNSLQYLSIIDIKNIAIYIKNIFNKNNNFKNYNLIKNKKKIKLIFNKIINLYKKNCNICHNINCIGKFPIYPNILYIFNYNNIENIINNLNKKKTNILSTFKMYYTSVMPNFKNIIKNINIKELIIFLKLIKNKF